jgi:orotidine-5'-phosphate decarboxylase
MNQKPQLCLALDAMSSVQAIEMADNLSGAIDIMKIGLGLYGRGGNALVAAFHERGFSVFLDLKLHDIPSQVGDAVHVAAQLGVDYLTVHTGGGRAMLEAASGARDGVSDSNLRLLGVTVLTSLSSSDLAEVGSSPDLAAVVRSRLKLAIETGLDGIVCSPADLSGVREIEGSAGLLKVTPGIRPAGVDQGDQRRVATPADAVAGGASILVVGRAIRGASDPRQAALSIRSEMGLS